MSGVPGAIDGISSLDPHELHQYWRLAETAFQIGSWCWNLETGLITLSAVAASLLDLPASGGVSRDGFLGGFDPADQEMAAIALDEAVEGQSLAVDVRCTKSDQAETRLRLVGALQRNEAGQPDRVLGLVISRNQQTHSDGASQLLSAIVASSDGAIISKIPDGTITSWNRAAEQIFGYSAAEMVGKPIAVLAVPGREDEMPAILDRLGRGEKVDHYETTRKHKDGSILQISLTVSPIYDEDGRFIGASKVARDITAARQVADALRETRERLREQHTDLLHVARLGELGQMAASLAHELNQPLTAIVTYLRAGQRLLASPDPSNLSQLDVALTRSAEQAVRASKIIRGLRVLAKRSDSDPSAEVVTPLVEEAVNLATIDGQRRGVRVQLDLDPSGRLVVVDRVQIQQVLLNLIRNAMEAMDGQDRAELRVTTVARENAVEVRVSDTGPGLSAAISERLFQPFVTTKINGMGIGLSICQRIIQAHGGRLWVEDNPGGGSVFAFTLRFPASA